MVGYFDTSLLFNVYIPQATGTASALGMIRKAAPVVLTPFGYAELRNAIRLARFRGEISDGELDRSLARLEKHVRSTRLYVWHDPIWAKVFERAEQIGEQVTKVVGVRSMDLMHLAVALEVGATDFFSADGRQCDGAEKLGLVVHRS